MAEIQRARAKWLGEWEATCKDESVPSNGYRAVHDLMQVIDLDNTIAMVLKAYRYAAEPPHH